MIFSVPKHRSIYFANNMNYSNKMENIVPLRAYITLNECDEMTVKFYYRHEMVEFIKGIQGRRYNASTKSWTIPKGAFDIVVHKLEELNYKIIHAIDRDRLTRKSIIIEHEYDGNVELSIPFTFQYVPLYELMSKNAKKHYK